MVAMSGEDAGETSWQFGAAIFAFYAVVVHDLSGQLRVDAAFRDAQDGYRQCPVCGFENFKRFPSCALCGAPLDAKTDGAAAGVRGSTLTQAATERQRRARTRKEWTRRADVHGHLFWFRDDNVDADTRFPGCTLTLSAIQQPALQLDQTQRQSQDQSVELELIVEVPPAPLSAAPDADSARFLSKQEVMRSLELETQPLTLTLTLADVSSPAQMPVSVVASPEPTHAASDQQQSLPWPDQLADPAAGVFACVNQAEQTYTLAAGARVSASAAQRHSGDNSDGDGSSDTVVNSEHLLYCFGAGRLVGRALLEGQWLLAHDGVDALGLTFSVVEQRADGRHQQERDVLGAPAARIPAPRRG
ncbi:hypothetical protein PybrP1_010504 [[Pythium] brassicae (nom. inval.)]|nr:hypothetical protein PybrP1_010504 [[Pythium] brassicae (nom. inval.)]